MKDVTQTIANCARHIRDLSERIERRKRGEVGTGVLSRSRYIETLETLLEGWRRLRASLRAAEREVRAITYPRRLVFYVHAVRFLALGF